VVDNVIGNYRRNTLKEKQELEEKLAETNKILQK